MKKVQEGFIYRVNEERFLLAINQGEVFKTCYSSIEKNDCNGKTHWKQIFSYQFDQEFIKKQQRKIRKVRDIRKN